MDASTYMRGVIFLANQREICHQFNETDSKVQNCLYFIIDDSIPLSVYILFVLHD
jgi:hypothetical protein